MSEAKNRSETQQAPLAADAAGEAVAWRWRWNGIVKSDWNTQAECPAPVEWTNPAWTIEYGAPALQSQQPKWYVEYADGSIGEYDNENEARTCNESRIVSVTAQQPVSERVAERAIEARNAWLEQHSGDAVGGMKAALDAAQQPTPSGGDAMDAAFARLNTLYDSLQGCSDGNCVIRKPVGIHTNGGCRCWGDRMKAQRVMRAVAGLRAALTTGKAEGEG